MVGIREIWCITGDLVYNGRSGVYSGILVYIAGILVYSPGTPPGIPPLYYPGYTTILPSYTAEHVPVTAASSEEAKRPWAQEGNNPWVREREVSLLRKSVSLPMSSVRRSFRCS